MFDFDCSMEFDSSKSLDCSVRIFSNVYRTPLYSIDRNHEVQNVEVSFEIRIRT